MVLKPKFRKRKQERNSSIEQLETREFLTAAPFFGMPPETAGDEVITLRMAIATVPTLTSALGGKTQALAAVKKEIGHLNETFGRELAVQFELVSDTDMLELMFESSTQYAPVANSAYPTNSTTHFDYHAPNQINIDHFVGSDNYDIGCVFSDFVVRGSISGSANDDVNKSRCALRIDAPDLNDDNGEFLVAHEIVHMLGATHTDGLYENSNFFGSIMTFTGFEGRTNFAHAASFDQVQKFVDQNLNESRFRTSNNNSIPTVDAGNATYTVPTGTSFEIKAVGADNDVADQNRLTYTFDQVDTSPIFQALPPSNSNTRVFPNPSNTGGQFGESAPTAARDLYFRVSVRDNHVSGSGSVVSGVNSDDVKVSVLQSAPFRITSHNTRVNLTGGANEQITWDVGDTANAATINTPLVRVLMTVDGGQSYTVLKDNVPNIGSTTVQIPNVATTAAKFKIEGVGNIFFDVTDTEISINSPPVVGIDFDFAGFTGGKPTNWHQVLGSSSNNQMTLSNLHDESNQATNIDLTLGNFFGGGWTNPADLANSIPSHVPNLGELASIARLGSGVIATWSGLTPGTTYNVYVFGHDTSPIDQSITITGSEALPPFTQTANANQLVVNERIGSNQEGLQDFAVSVGADDSGNIVISAPSGAWVAGLAIQERPIPPMPTSNDNFANAASLVAEQLSQVNTNGFTRETGEPLHHDNSSASTAWYNWTASSTGRFAVATSNTDFDTILAVYTGATVNTLTRIESNDDIGGGSTDSRVEFDAQIGQTYRIAVAGFEMASGTTDVTLTATAPVVPEIEHVQIGSTQWSSEFRDAIDRLNNESCGSSCVQNATNFYVVESGTVPWSNINQIRLLYSNTVGSVNSSMFTVNGVLGGSYNIASATSDGNAVLLQLDRNIGRDAVTVTTNNFSQRINVLPGDTDRSGQVSVADVAGLRSNLGRQWHEAEFFLDFIFADTNGSGAMAVNDLGPIRQNLGLGVPAVPVVAADLTRDRIDAIMDELDGKEKNGPGNHNDLEYDGAFIA